MSTLATIKARIVVELGNRTDLTTQIASAINDAIAAYQKQRFRFSDVAPNAPPTFPTVAGRSVYTSADNANIASALGIDYVTVLVGNTQVPLGRDTPENLFLYNQSGTMSGQPSWFAYEGNQLIISPVPTQAWTVTLGLFKLVAAPATDVETGNPWMTDGERLIRARAKFEIATHVTRNPVMAKAMSPSPPAENEGMVGAAYREWKALKGEAARITGTGRIRATRF